MIKTTITFPDISTMASFILRFHLSGFVPGWRAVSLTGEMEIDLISAALDEHGAKIIEIHEAERNIEVLDTNSSQASDFC